MDGLRDSAVAESNATRWIPEWGRERMTGMFVSRPDWCISRQRAWGVPIPSLRCTGCDESVMTPDIVERAAAIFATDGADAWYERPASDFTPPGLACEGCGGTAFAQDRDILDVWFDSGSSHEAVLAKRPDLTWPADLYLEGTDQYRGWFQSSMLVGLGTRDKAPYHAVLTHGFVVDLRGRKMSKSLGNVISPQKVIDESGAEVLRLWVSMVDYQDEVRLGQEVLARTVEAYRKIRNTFRYLLSNLYDFDPTRHALAVDALLEVDRFALARFADVEQRVREAYEAYDFQAIFQALNEFVTVDLSAFYLDVSKDRLYTFGADSVERRSAQTAQYIIADALTRLIAPILSVTAEHVWTRLPGAREASVHLAEFATGIPSWRDPGLEARWARLREVRDTVNAALEGARQRKEIGSALAAHVTVRAAGPQAALLEQYRDDLPMLFITSGVTLAPGTAGLEVDVTRAPGEKCPRCWRIVTGLTTTGTCARCGAAMRADDAV
jgi:isoleucyl-tRNA synthetase